MDFYREENVDESADGLESQFQPQDFESLILAWLAHMQAAKLSYTQIEKREGSLWLHLNENAQLQIQPQRIRFHGKAASDDAAIKAALLHVQKAWNGSCYVRGSDDFKFKSWVHAQALGVEIQNYHPRLEQMAEAYALIEQIKNGTRENKANVDAQTKSADAEQSEPVSLPHRYRPDRYVPPRNAVNELFQTTSPVIHDIMHEALAEVERSHPTGEWPEQPYHYGMGRIMGYDSWLGSLSKEEREEAISASRVRYEQHYQKQADLLVEKMREKGYHLMPNRPAGMPSTDTNDDPAPGR